MSDEWKDARDHVMEFELRVLFIAWTKLTICAVSKRSEPYWLAEMGL